MTLLFVLLQDNDSGQEDFSDSDSDIPDELKNDYIDELTGETHSRYDHTAYCSASEIFRLNIIPLYTNGFFLLV